MGVHSVIVGTGSFIPEIVVLNSYFLDRTFYDSNGNPLQKPIEDVVATFEQITEIKERRYAHKGQTLADLAVLAGQAAMDSAGVTGKDLDGLIIAHNAGGAIPNADVGSKFISELKARLEIVDPGISIEQITTGCSGWVRGLQEANNHIKYSGQTALVIGAELISPYLDIHDQDSMIFADGAGAVVIRRVESEHPVGILSYDRKTNPNNGRFNQGPSYNRLYRPEEVFLHMNGQAVYKYVVRHVPKVVRSSIEMAGLGIDDIAKNFFPPGKWKDE